LTTTIYIFRMATNQAGSSASSAPREYTVRVPKGVNKKFSVLKFNPANNVDFQKCEGAKLERENNFREYKISHDIDLQPKFGAGSEYGREQKDEARRKKFGIQSKRYNPDDQPWVLRMGSGKTARKFKGVKGGGVLENAKYYIFTQSPDGSFEAFPLKEWYNFMPVSRYKALNAEEAEEQFLKRDRTLNYFSVMLQKRLKNEDIDDIDPDEGGTKGKKKNKKKDFKLTELDEWAELSDGDSESDGSVGSDDKPKKKAPKPKTSKKAKKKDRDVNAEASEDSEGDSEGHEVDYMTDTDSEDDDMNKNENRGKSDKYADKGVEDEEGLRKVIATDDEDEDEEKNEEEEEEEVEDTDQPKKEGKKAEAAKGKAESDSESSDSASDSDLEKDDKLNSALFMQKKDKPKSRSATPTPGDSEDKKGKKRKNGDRDSPVPKKSKTDSRSSTPTPAPPVASTLTPLTGVDATIEETVRRYLQRKPMDVKLLLQKTHKNTGINKETLSKTIPQILKRLNPEKVNIGGKLHLHIKKTE